jgi:hypothetical protein
MPTPPPKGVALRLRTQGTQVFSLGEGRADRTVQSRLERPQRRTAAGITKSLGPRFRGEERRVGGGAEQACKPPLRANSPCDAAQNRTLGSAAGGGSARPTAPAQRGRGTDRRAQRRAVGGGGKPRARRPGSRPPPGLLRRGPALPAACPHPHVLFAAPGGRSPSPVSTAELGSQKAREPEVVAAEIRTFPTSVRGGK